MNKTVMFVTFAALTIFGLAGAVILLIFRPEASQDFINLLITVLGLATTAGGTFYALGKQGKELATIKNNTNGTLSARDDEIARLRSVLATYAPHALQQVDTGSIPTTREQLKAETEGS